MKVYLGWLAIVVVVYVVKESIKKSMSLQQIHLLCQLFIRKNKLIHLFIYYTRIVKYHSKFENTCTIELLMYLFATISSLYCNRIVLFFKKQYRMGAVDCLKFYVPAVNGTRALLHFR